MEKIKNLSNKYFSYIKDYYYYERYLIYELLINKYYEYRRTVVKGVKSHDMFFNESKAFFEYKAIETIKKENPSESRYLIYKKIELLFDSHSNLVLNYYNLPLFNHQSVKSLLNELNNSKNNLDSLSNSLLHDSTHESLDLVSSTPTTELIVNELNNKDLLMNITSFVKDHLDEFGSEQATRIGCIVIDEKLITPNKNTGKERLIAWNKELSLEGKNKLTDERLIKNTLSRGANRTDPSNRNNVKELIEFFENMKWPKGIQRINQILSKKQSPFSPPKFT